MNMTDAVFPSLEQMRHFCNESYPVAGVLG